MNLGISFSPLVPSYVVWGAVVVAFAISLLIVLGRTRGALVRTIALALFVLALANPSITREDRDPLTSVAVVVVDKSPSQEFGDRRKQTEAVRAALAERLGRMPGIEVRFVEAGQADGETDGTRLFAALSSALSDVPHDRVAGALFITDGRVHDVPSEAAALGFAAPVHGLITGHKNERDRRVVLTTAPRFGIVGQSQTITFRVEDQGAAPGTAQVTVRRDGETIENRNVRVGASSSVSVQIPHAGPNIVEIEASPLDGELTGINNRAVVSIDGVRDKLRVLLVSGEPHAGERTWRNLLKSDASVDLVHFTILRPPEKQDGTPIKELSLIAFPTRELFVEKLDEFDLIIFDRYQRRGILPMMYLANIADYVKRGGAVLIAAGPDFAAEDGLYNTPLNAVLQVVPSGQILEGGFKPQVTERGQRHPVTRGLPGAEGTTPNWGRWFRLVDAEAQSGEVVMSGLDNKPLLVLSREEQGRLALLLSDHGWLWARGFEGGGPQTELLRRLAHWLMKEPDLEEEYLSGKQDNDNITIERRTMADTANPVTVTLPSGATKEVGLKQVTPGVWRASLPVTEPGIHRLADGKLTAAVAIGSADPKETADPVATESKLAPVAKATGGGLYWLEDYSSLPRIGKADAGRQMAGSGWLALKANNAHRVRAVHELPLFSTLGSLALLLMAFAAMWYREGR